MKKLTLLALLYFFLGSIPAHAAISFYAVGETSLYGGDGTINLSASGNNAVVVYVPGCDASNVTVGGVSGAEVVSFTGSVGHSEAWIVKMGGTSSNSALGATGCTNLRAISYSGVDQTNPVDNSTSNTGSSVTSLSISLTPSGSNEWMWSAWSTNGGSAVNSANYTLRSVANPTGCVTLNPCAIGDSNAAISGATTQTVGSSGAQDFDMIAMTLNPAGTASSVITSITGLVRAFWLW